MVKTCLSCGLNPVRTFKARYCEVCAVALAKVRTQIATYKHRERVRKGVARHNTTYGGAPTKWMKENLDEMTLGDILVKKPELATFLLRQIIGV